MRLDVYHLQDDASASPEVVVAREYQYRTVTRWGTLGVWHDAAEVTSPQGRPLWVLWTAAAAGGDPIEVRPRE